MTEMTTPERGLFERIYDEIGKYGNDRTQIMWPNVRAICADFEQRLAEAERQARENAFRVIAELEIADQLKARVAELEGALVLDEKVVRLLTKNRLLNDVYAWADGVLGGYGTEYASRITEDEGHAANAIMRFDNYLQRRWGKQAITAPAAGESEQLEREPLAEHDECKQSGRHDWKPETGGERCFYCGEKWWANTPEPKTAQEQTTK
jgi:hypothetical protein